MAERDREIIIKPNQRVAYVGKTNSGKTFLARHILLPFPRLIVFDSKGTMNLTEWKLSDSDATKRALKRGEPGRLWVPTPPGNDWTRWLDFIWEIRNVTLYVDEMMAVVPPRKSAPDQLNSLYTRGREFGIGVHASMQRPAWVPPFTLSEAEWLFVFRLSRAADRKAVSDFGDEYETMRNPVPDEHGFFIYNQTWRRPRYLKRFNASSVESSQGGAKAEMPASATPRPVAMQGRGRP